MINKDVLISVVVPAYNYAHTLARTIDSVVSQLTDECELLIIDDGSTDTTRQVIAELHRRYPARFRALYQANAGLASVRNLGIDQALGQYLIFLDADDEMAPNAIAALLAHLRQNPTTRMVIGGHLSVYATGKHVLQQPVHLPAQPLNRVRGYLLDKTLPISNGACAMHREVFAIGRYPVQFRNAEDIPVFAQVLARYECTILNAPLALIYKHDDSLRHNLEYSMQIGEELIEEVFDSKRLPQEFNVLRRAFVAQRNLSLFRAFAAVGRKAEALGFYKKAIKADLKSLFKWSYTRKAVRLWVKP